MKKLSLFLLIFLSCLCPAWSQYDPLWEDHPIDQMVGQLYAAGLLRNMKIKSIEAEYSVKPEGGRIYRTGQKKMFLFHSNGMLREAWEVFGAGNKDTTLTLLFSNSDSTWQVKRTQKGPLINATYIRTDEQFRPIDLIRCTELSEESNLRFFKPLSQQVLNRELFSYEKQSGEFTKVIYMNDQRIPYKEGLRRDSAGLFISEVIRFINTGIQVIRHNEYENGKLINSHYETDANGKYSEGKRFFYSENRLSEVKAYRNTLPVEEQFWFYNKEGLPESIMVKKTRQYDIIFYNFTYTYYP